MKDTNDLYQIGLKFDELLRDDIEEPIVLVKDYRNARGQDLVEFFTVPKVKQGSAGLIDGPHRGSGCIINNQVSTSPRSKVD